MSRKSKLIMIVMYYITSIYTMTPLIVLYKSYKNINAMAGKMPDIKQAFKLYNKPMELIKIYLTGGVIIPWLILSTAVLIGMVIIYIAARESSTEIYGIDYKKDEGTHGTASWMEEKEAHKILSIGKRDGIILGKINEKTISLPNKSIFNRNVAIFGASGSGKSRRYVRPNIIQMANEGHSIVVTDPKGELYTDMAEYLREKGYDVRCFNLVNMLYSDRWNPLNEIKSDIDAQLFADVIISNTKAVSNKQGGDPFWDRAEQNLLKALTLYVAKEYPEDQRNIASIYNLIAAEEAKKVDETFKRIPQDHPAKMPYNIYKQANDTVRTGVIIGLGTRLQVFQNKLVQELTKESDIDLTKPKKEKCAYFCISSDTDSTFDFLAGLFFSFMFIDLIRYADLHGRGKDVYFLLDEFPNIALIPDFQKKISTMRSRGVHSHVIFQNIAQLKNRYPNDMWQEIIGNCDTRLFLGCTDIMTAEFVCDILGTTTVGKITHTKQAGLEGLLDYGKIARTSGERNLLNPDEILRLHNDNAIVMLRGQKPLMIEKLDYSEMKESKKLKPRPIISYEYEWSKEIKEIIKKQEQKREEKKNNNNKAAETENKEVIIEETIKDEDKDINTVQNKNEIPAIKDTTTEQEENGQATKTAKEENIGLETQTIIQNDSNNDNDNDIKEQKKENIKNYIETPIEKLLNTTNQQNEINDDKKESLKKITELEKKDIFFMGN